MELSKEKMKKDIKINRFRLDEESEKQPSLYFYYANELAELKKEKDKLETRLNLILSEVDLDIRKNPPDGIKITESTIKSLVETNERVIHLKNEINKKKGDIYILTAVTTSLEQRNSQLKVLKDLFLSNYFGIDDKKTFEGSSEARKRLNKK